MEITKEFITPAIAASYLRMNVINRRVKSPVVLRYANEMANGRWKQDTGELIKISKSGKILDGQHRLLAVIKANVGIYFHVARNLDEMIFDVLDTGSSRNATDVFFINKVKHSNVLPSIIQTYNILKSGYSLNAQKNYKLTNNHLSELYQQNEDFWQKIALKTIQWYLGFSKILAPSYIGGCYAAFSEINEIQANQFMNALCNGVYHENNVIAMLRNKLISDKMSLKKMPANVKLMYVVKVWNYYRKGTCPVIISYNPEREKTISPI